MAGNWRLSGPPVLILFFSEFIVKKTFSTDKRVKPAKQKHRDQMDTVGSTMVQYNTIWLFPRHKHKITIQSLTIESNIVEY